MTTQSNNASHHCIHSPVCKFNVITMQHSLLLIFAVLLSALFFLFSSPAAAGEFDDLPEKINIDAMTWQERMHFTEALDKFPKRWLRKDFEAISIVRWLDDEHLVFTTTSYPGWKGHEAEPARVIALHVDTGKLTDIGYRGQLKCLNHKGELMIRLNPERRQSVGHPKDDRWLIGIWGQPLQEIKWEPNSFIPRYLCRFASYGDPIHTTPIADLPPNAHRIHPLLPEHGVLKETVTVENRYKVNPVSLIKPDGTQVSLKMVMPIADSFYYQPWQGTYFNTRVSRDSSLTINPSGEMTQHRPPRLLMAWDLANVSHASAFGTRPGILWTVSTISERWGKQGLFLETAKELLKIEDGRSLGAVISPNGCRIWTTIVQGDPYAKEPGPRGQIVIDICKQGEQQ